MTAIYRICRKELQILKFRNIQVAKITGTRFLAALLTVGLTFSAPVAAYAADDGNYVQTTSKEAGDSANSECLQAKSIDGRDTYTEVSDLVLEMIQRGEAEFNEETGYV